MSDLPARLYKFQRFSAKTLKCLAGGQMIYSDPSSFNDPFDCHADVINDLEPESLAALLSEMLMHSLKKQRKFTVKKVKARIDFHKTRQDPEESMRGEVEELLKKSFEGYGVLCLSASLMNPLMWAHYADNHQGLCLEYDRWEDLNLPGKIGLKPVDYDGTKQIHTSWLHQRFVQRKGRDSSRITNAYFFSKSAEWGYEEEWREVSSDLDFPRSNSDITAVYFGYRCPVEVKWTVARLFKGQRFAPDLYDMSYLAKDKCLNKNKLSIEALVQQMPECGKNQLQAEAWSKMIKELFET